MSLKGREVLSARGGQRLFMLGFLEREAGAVISIVFTAIWLIAENGRKSELSGGGRLTMRWVLSVRQVDRYNQGKRVVDVISGGEPDDGKFVAESSFGTKV